MTQPLLEVKGLKTWFPQQDSTIKAVDGIDFTIEKGQTVALLGESGCGKSLTALSILRLNPQPASRVVEGEINFKGTDLLTLSEVDMLAIRGGDIAMIFQEPQSSLNPVITIGRQIDEILESHTDLDAQQRKQRCVALLDEVGIPEPQHRVNVYPHQLSGGMKQRVMIAMALAAEPELLIADEPTTALDVTIQAQILELLNTLQKKKGMAILFITHDLAVASQMADKVSVMYAGKIVENGICPQFFAQPQHSYTQQLFDALPTAQKRELKLASMEHSDAESQQNASAPLLEVDNLKVYFPIKKGILQRTVGHVKAVDDVSFTLNAGETLAVVGESGSGKTTIGKAILQLIKPTAGSVKYQNQSLTTLSHNEMQSLRASLQIVFQDPYSAMNPRMTIAQIIGEALTLTDIKEPQAQLARIDELLEKVGLNAEHKFRYPHQFSGGQRQRICIARALAAEPKVIICDEPTSALDVSVQAQILDLLWDLQAELGLSYLFITHNIAVVDYLAHRIAVVYKGKLVEIGDRDQVLNQPQHSYTQQLLSAVPHLAVA